MKNYIVTLLAILVFSFSSATAQELPLDNPMSDYDLQWTDSIQWKNVVDIHQFEGETWDDKWVEARDTIAQQGGGVVYFPGGDYEFDDTIQLVEGVVIRGEKPVGKAIFEDYTPQTKLIFPNYQPTFEGDGTPNDSAFKMITVKNPSTDSHCGIVNVSIQFGAIYFPEGANHQVGKNRFVYGCRLEAAARVIDSVPKDWQHAWQRFNHRHRAAIHVFTQENAFIANNRLANSQQHNFAMPGYRIKKRDNEIITMDEITFDYDNRPGIVVNGFAIGAVGGNPPDGTPDSHPHGFRNGIVIRDNSIFSTGGYAIQFTGDGTYCGYNQIRFAPNVRRYTVTGEKLSSGSSTNGNRAVEMRGWRYTIEDNDYEVYSNIAADGNYRINDGEGLMHEDHVNSIVKDSRIVDNTGNTYISIYKTGGIDGLLVQGNKISSRIFVVANRNSGDYPCKNVSIEGNETPTIHIAGDPAENNVVQNNINPEGSGGLIKNHARAMLENNRGYEVEGFTEVDRWNDQ